MYVASWRRAAPLIADLTSPCSCQGVAFGSFAASANFAKMDSVLTLAFGPGAQLTFSASRAFTAASEEVATTATSCGSVTVATEPGTFLAALSSTAVLLAPSRTGGEADVAYTI